jgi:uncharacterized repeat protein (TIGR03803 family)
MDTRGQIWGSYSFSGPDGANPSAALIQGNDGNFYGTTVNGGSSNYGAVFQLSFSTQCHRQYFSISRGHHGAFQLPITSGYRVTAALRCRFPWTCDPHRRKNNAQGEGLHAAGVAKQKRKHQNKLRKPDHRNAGFGVLFCNSHAVISIATDRRDRAAALKDAQGQEGAPCPRQGGSQRRLISPWVFRRHRSALADWHRVCRKRWNVL